RVKQDLGSVRALDLSKEAVKLYMRNLLESGLRKATINRFAQTLRRGYTLAELPAPKIDLLDESDNVREGFFGETEIRRVMANLPTDLADFTLFAWLTGMRKREISSLRWADLDGDVLTLRAENAKTGRSRSIPCEGELLELLERRRQRQSVRV